MGNDSASVRWLIGENVTGLGAFRSMSNPPAFNDPDKMTSPHYFKGYQDNGGMHYNSGVNNKAIFLMVDGGSFNGRNVQPIGWDKTAAIYYEVQTNLLTSGADYADLYHAVYQACLTLIDGPNNIKAEDCQQVRAATDAVEMNLQPAAKFNTDAPLCGNDQPVHTVFFDDLEQGASNWTFINGASARWQYDSPYGTYAHSGSHFLYADDYPPTVTSASAMLTPVHLPDNAYLHFAHAYDFERFIDNSAFFDGGVLEYTTDEGFTWMDAAPFMDYNAYSGSISSKYDNPLKGKPAFVGSSHGYISTRLNLSFLAGETVQFRWRLGLDSGGYYWGWFVDDVHVFTCPNAQSVTLTSIGELDNWILESTETSGVGGKLNKGAATLNIGDDKANRQYRAILSFDTSSLSSLPEGAEITSVTLQFKYAGKKGTLPFSTHGKLLVDAKIGSFSNNPALQKGDFQFKGSKNNLFALTKKNS
jgi:bacillolysin